MDVAATETMIILGVCVIAPVCIVAHFWWTIRLYERQYAQMLMDLNKERERRRTTEDELTMDKMH